MDPRRITKKGDQKVPVVFDQDGVIGRILARNPFPTERELARHLQMSPNTWTAYKTGRQSLKLAQVAEICDLLNVDADWLLFGRDYETAALVQRAMIGAEKAPVLSVVPRITPEHRLLGLQDDVAPRLDVGLLGRIGQVVKSAYEAAGENLSEGLEFEEAGRLYNELIAVVRDYDDAIIEALLPVLRQRLHDRLQGHSAMSAE